MMLCNTSKSDCSPERPRNRARDDRRDTRLSASRVACHHSFTCNYRFCEKLVEQIGLGGLNGNLVCECGQRIRELLVLRRSVQTYNPFAASSPTWTRRDARPRLRSRAIVTTRLEGTMRIEESCPHLLLCTHYVTYFWSPYENDVSQ